jgi:outer membrane protein assembly factor BamB
LTFLQNYNIKGGAGMRKHTKALATIMAAAALAMVTNSRIPITNIWYYVGQDGKWYCFDRNNGDMKRGTTIDGYTVDFILAGFREKELCAD